MSDVKRLLEEATPLPWRDEPYMAAADHSFGCDINSGPIDRDYAERVTYGGLEGLDASVPYHADAALIVHAVNSLPAYEAAVEALERLAHYTDAAAECHGNPECDHGKWLRSETDLAREALRRLREEAS